MDNRIKEVIAEVAKELGITEFKTTKVVENVFNYMKNSMTKLESESYYIPKFGKFCIIKKRYDKHTETRRKKRESKLDTNITDESVDNN